MATTVLYKNIPYQSPAIIFQQLANQPDMIFLDSASNTAETGRYSFIGIDPVDIVTGIGQVITTRAGRQYCDDPFAYMQNWLATSHHTPISDLPPFQCGLAGICAYDSLPYFHPITLAEPSRYYDWAMAYYDLIISFDHDRQQAWIIANGYPEDEAAAKNRRAQARIHWCMSLLAQHAILPDTTLSCSPLKSNFTPMTYQLAVQKAIDYIRAGDVFEVNLAQRFTATYQGHPARWYQRLRSMNPAPFSGYTNLAGVHILSSSPERFLQLRDRAIEARPIKGTIGRSLCSQQDQQQATALQQSTKDRAENIMIVDLMRNDISRVAEPHSVTVPVICGLESYANVHHLVSVVSATLSADSTAGDVLRATFPAGSITGAPKIRAMEIIAELEPHNRGIYCGSMGYMSASGDMDWNVMIRSLIMQDQTLQMYSGGAITLDSCPQSEYQETCTKAMKLAESLGVVLPYMEI